MEPSHAWGISGPDGRRLKQRLLYGGGYGGSSYGGGGCGSGGDGGDGGGGCGG